MQRAGATMLKVTTRAVGLIAAVCGLASVLLTSALTVADSPQPAAPPPPPVTTALPLAKRITTWDEYSGRFEAVESVEVRARVSGFIDKVLFKDGQLVKVGDPLFTIDPRPFEIALDTAKAEAQRAKAQVALGESEVNRARPLVKSGVVTERDFDQRSANLNVARAQLKAAESAIESAELNLEWSRVKAPISGRISDRKVDAGNLIAGGAASPTLLTTIVSIDPIHFAFDVSETDYLRYARLNVSGQRDSSRTSKNPVRIKLADETAFKHEGTMDFVDNQLNVRSGTMRGRALVKNPDQILQPGIFARVQLFGGDADVLLVPDEAIQSDQARKILLTVDGDNTVVAKPVTLGPLYEGLRAVKDGLTASDQIIIQGFVNPAVRPGTKVTPSTGEIKPIALNDARPDNAANPKP
jgi:membrane fusion protein, multidrug efflux system